MGMFDTLWDNSLRCPYCAGVVREIQTKDLENCLDDYSVCQGKTCWCKRKIPGIFAGSKHAKSNLVRVTGLAWCGSPECSVVSKSRDLLQNGSVSRRTCMYFDVEYTPDKKGTVCAPARVIKDKKALSVPQAIKLFARALHQLGPGPNNSFDRLLKKYGGDWALAMLMWEYMPGFKSARRNAELLKDLGHA